MRENGIEVAEVGGRETTGSVLQLPMPRWERTKGDPCIDVRMSQTGDVGRRTAIEINAIGDEIKEGEEEMQRCNVWRIDWLDTRFSPSLRNSTRRARHLFWKFLLRTWARICIRLAQGGTLILILFISYQVEKLEEELHMKNKKR